MTDVATKFSTGRGIEGAPDLVVEILSPSAERRDRGAKRQIYAKYGVGCYWLVGPDACSIEIHALRGSEYEVVGTHTADAVVTVDVPARLTIPLADVWRWTRRVTQDSLPSPRGRSPAPRARRAPRKTAAGIGPRAPGTMLGARLRGSVRSLESPS